LASAGGDSTVKLWNLAVQQEAATFKGHNGQVAAVAFAPNGNLLASTGADGRIRLWRASPFAETDVAESNNPPVPEPPLRVTVVDGGFLRDWLILAPIPLADGQTGADAVDKQQIPGEASLRPKAGQRVKIENQEFVWKEHHERRSIIDFNAFLGQETVDSVAYAVCYILSDQDRRDLRLLIGSDDQAKVYLNGKEEYKHPGARAVTVDEDTTEGLILKQGINVLMFKVVNEAAAWEGCIRFVDERGNPVTGLQVRLTPD
jgi:hypothetical protein